MPTFLRPYFTTLFQILTVKLYLMCPFDVYASLIKCWTITKFAKACSDKALNIDFKYALYISNSILADHFHILKYES